MVRRLKGSATLDENAILRAHARAHARAQDTPEAMAAWVAAGKRVAIFSSGSREADGRRRTILRTRRPSETHVRVGVQRRKKLKTT